MVDVKKSEAIYALSLKLQKQEALFKGYGKGSINLKCLCDNLSSMILTCVEDEIGMSPPSYNENAGFCRSNMVNKWESKDEE